MSVALVSLLALGSLGQRLRLGLRCFWKPLKAEARTVPAIPRPYRPTLSPLKQRFRLRVRPDLASFLGRLEPLWLILVILRSSLSLPRSFLGLS